MIVDCYSASNQNFVSIDERYTNSAKNLKDRLYNEVMKNEVNLMDQNIDIIEERRQVSINMFHKGLLSNQSVYDKDGGFICQNSPTMEMRELAKTKVSVSKYFSKLKEVPLGAFEVYFMGNCVYSKLKTKKWPNLDSLVEKCKKLYTQY